MSADDPTDDELEREAMRDVPVAMGGGGRHAPRLSDEPRAINLRDRATQDALQLIREERGRERDRLDNAMQPPPMMAPPAPRLAPAVTAAPKLGARTAPPSGMSSEAEVWDGYILAALVAGAHLGQDDAGSAVGLADYLLEQRRQRFGRP